MLFNFGISIQRFPEYEELSDGTLSRIEGSKEFQVYPDDIKRCPFHEVTQELLAEHRGSPCRKASRTFALWRSQGFPRFPSQRMQVSCCTVFYGFFYGEEANPLGQYGQTREKLSIDRR